MKQSSSEQILDFAWNQEIQLSWLWMKYLFMLWLPSQLKSLNLRNSSSSFPPTIITTHLTLLKSRVQLFPWQHPLWSPIASLNPLVSQTMPYHMDLTVMLRLSRSVPWEFTLRTTLPSCRYVLYGYSNVQLMLKWNQWIKFSKDTFFFFCGS